MIGDELNSIILDMINKDEDPFPEIQGQASLKRQILSALLSGRSIIIEGYPGVGKTTIAKAVAKLLPDVKAVKGCPHHCDPKNPICPSCKSDGKDGEVVVSGEKRFIRIQGSPDLQVEDLLGDIDPALAFEYGPTDPRAFKPGKLLKANRGVLFFDELNRCPERLQNALLQVLEEGEATIGGYSVTYPANFILIATMNPAEFAGTERLSDVLLDRFDIVRMDYPENGSVEREIVLGRGKKLLPVPDDILVALTTIVRSTRKDERIEVPAGVRATIGLYERAQANALLKKKKFVEIEDVKEIAPSVLAHRIKLAPKVKHTHSAIEIINQIIEEALTGKGPPKTVTGQVIMGMVNHGIQSLDSAHIARMLINNLQSALDFLGKKTITELTGLGERDLRKREKQSVYLNELKDRIDDKLDEMKKDGLIDEQGKVTERGLEIAIEETLRLEGFGGGEHAQADLGKDVIVGLKKFSGGYRDLAFRATLKKTLLHGRRKPIREDWVGFDKRKAERVDFLFLLDSSGSMKGSKIEACKKAALSLASRCNRKGDRMAVISFNDEAEIVSPLGERPHDLAVSVMKITPSGTTDLAKALAKVFEVIEPGRRSKHVILISDAVPNKGDKPVEAALEQAEKLSASKISLSVVGIELGSEAEQVARMLSGTGRGKFYQVSRPDQIRDKIMRDVSNY